MNEKYNFCEDLKTHLNSFKEHKHTDSYEELSRLRALIFMYLEDNLILESQKDDLIKELYNLATDKGMFFIRITERNKEVKLEEDIEYEESYEESYEEDNE